MIKLLLFNSDGKFHVKDYHFFSKPVVIMVLLLFLSISAFSVEPENRNYHLTGNATFTTKGLSTFPNLTLGKPAVIFNFSVGSARFMFDPTLRFGIDGNPWTFIFWLRYEAIQAKNFDLRIGVHPAYSFKKIDVETEGRMTGILRTQQFLAFEIAPLFKVGKNVSMGPHYIFSYGVDREAVRFSNFISLITNISNIQLTENLVSNLMVQVYSLKMDANNGYYFNSTLSFSRRNFPVSLSTTVNKAIDSTLPGEKFLWNLNLTYRFGGLFRRI